MEVAIALGGDPAMIYAASAPLPKLGPQEPAWGEAAEYARGLGLNGLAKRLAERS